MKAQHRAGVPLPAAKEVFPPGPLEQGPTVKEAESDRRAKARPGARRETSRPRVRTQKKLKCAGFGLSDGG